MNKITYLIMLLLLVSPVYALDLSEFPEFFLTEGVTDVTIIIGKAAKAEDVIGSISIATAIQNVGGKKDDVAKLDSEIDVLSEQNTIIVGGPCANAAAAKLLGYPQNCMEGFSAGKGIIKLYEFDNGKIAMLVAGALARDTRRTASVLADYAEYDLKGTEMEIASVATTNTQVVIK